MLKSVFPAVVIAIFIGGAATAQQADTPRGRTYDRQGFERGADRRFDRLDLNKDGIVDQQEQSVAIEAAVKRTRERMERSFRLTNKSGTGKITREEYRTASAALFDRMDADKDGKVTTAERQRFYQTRRRNRSNDDE